MEMSISCTFPFRLVRQIHRHGEYDVMGVVVEQGESRAGCGSVQSLEEHKRKSRLETVSLR